MNQIFAIFLPLIFAILLPFLFKGIKKVHTGWFMLIIPIVLVVYYSSFISTVKNGQTHVESLEWIPSLNISFDSYLDGLSLLFSLLITGIGALVVLYSIFYLDKTKEQLHNFYIYLAMFMTAMLGVVQSDHVIALYFFWELTSISSFLLIGYWFTRDASRFGALKSMMITVAGGLFMLGGFVLLAIQGGSYSIRELIENAPAIANEPYFVLALLFILLGAFTKSAQFPFYIWLPDAMEAPTPVSAYLHSATMVKAGIYLVARFTPLFALSEVWIWLVTGIGIVTLVWGSIFALKQTDLKAILAFSTVSQLGLIMALLGAGAMAYHVEGAASTVFKYAAFAAIFHLINHATFKGSLFMIAGIVDHETGTRNIRKLGGLMSIMPISFTIAMIGSLSMAGVPLLNGFLSKEMFLTAMLSVNEFGLFSFDTFGIVFPIIAWIASVFTFAYSLYFVVHTFMRKGNVEKLPVKPHEAPIGMLISPAILATLVVVLFFIPNKLAVFFIKPAVAAVQPFLYSAPGEVDIKISAWHGFNTELWMTLGIFIVGALAFAMLPKWQHVYEKWPKKITLNSFYDFIMNRALVGGIQRFEKLYMGGSIRTYIMYMMASLSIFIIGTLFIVDGFNFTFDGTSELQLYNLFIIGLLVVGTFVAAFSKSRIASIIGLGGVGYSVALFFVFFKAPDLALTQLVIETISVALFLLVFYHLPKFKPAVETYKFKIGRLLVSFLVGAMVTLVALSAQSQKLVDSIKTYYEETVYKLAGGGNIVNVILVDYRGFDTMFEIAVLSIAGMATFAMVKLRLSRKEHGDESK